MNGILGILTNYTIDIGDAKNIDVTALRVRVQKSFGAVGIGTANDSVGLGGGRSQGCGEEESGNGEELHVGW